MATDNAALVKRPAARAPAVPTRIQHAVEIMLDEPGAIDWQKLAERVGYRNAAELRRWMNKPQSMRYLRDRKRERLEAINVSNPESLRRVRDESGNSMAKVQAVRALESMSTEMDKQTGARTGAMPGFTIIISGPRPADIPHDPAGCLKYQDDPEIGELPRPKPPPALPAGPVIDVEPGEFRDESQA